MLYIGTKYMSSSASSIVLHDEHLELSSPNYKGGKVTSVNYSDVKSTSESDQGELILKIKRTEVVLGIFDREIKEAIIRFIEVGKSEPISKSKTWKRYQEDCRKEENRARRKEDRDASIQKIKAEAKLALANAAESIFAESSSSKATRKAREHNQALILLPSDSQEVMADKLQKQFSAYHSMSHNDNIDDELIEEALERISESVELFESKYPNSEMLGLFKKKLARITAKNEEDETSEANKTKWGCLAFVVLMIGMIVWESFKKDISIIELLKQWLQ